jgi:F-type H+-transporting ATPase subunit delta
VTGSLARRYARALLDLAREQQALERFGDDLSRAPGEFAQDDLRRVALNPAIDAGKRRALVRDVVASLGLDPLVGNLIRVLADHDRLGIIGDVARAYDALVDRELDRTRVRITSATPLSDAEETELGALARGIVGHGDVLVSSTVDPALVGGVVLGIGGTVYDGSLRTQLARLSHEMADDES